MMKLWIKSEADITLVAVLLFSAPGEQGGFVALTAIYLPNSHSLSSSMLTETSFVEILDRQQQWAQLTTPLLVQEENHN